MKKDFTRLIVSIFCSFLGLTLLMMISCGGGDGSGSGSGSTTFAQSDLQGTWIFHFLDAGPYSYWKCGTATLDSSGNLTGLSELDNTGSTTVPPPNSIQLTISTSGVISESGTNSDIDTHMTMTANKNFIAGTSSGYPPNPNYAFKILQKVVLGTVYSNADLQSKSFVFYQLHADGEWIYGTGTTNASRVLNISSETTPSGTSTPGNTGTLAVDGNGNVTLSGDTNFHGFLSTDKKTIVVTDTTDTSSLVLMIIQITNGQSSSTSQAAGKWYAHTFATGASPAPFWTHQTLDVTSGGVITYSDWVCSNPAVTGPTGTKTISIDSTGTATIADSDFHGQLSYDGKFMVGIWTTQEGAYALTVFTR